MVHVPVDWVGLWLKMQFKLMIKSNRIIINYLGFLTSSGQILMVQKSFLNTSNDKKK